MFDFLFNPNGRISRKGYAIGFFLPWLILSGLPSLFLVPQHGLGIYLAVAALFFFWPSIAVSIKRFHDLGLSGWFYIGAVVLIFAFQLYGALPLIAGAISDPALVESLEGATGFAAVKATFTFLADKPDRQIAYAASMVLSYGLMLLFLLVLGQRRANKFGADPLAGGMGFAD